MSSPQIPLNLEPSRPDRFEDFVSGPNRTALATVNDVLTRQGASVFLHGPASSGKTHLLNSLCFKAREHGMQAFYVALRRLPASAATSISGLENFDLVCIDDFDQIAGQRNWEMAVFNCFNQLRERGSRLVISSRVALADLQLGLGDLRSRLAWDVQAVLLPLDDEGKLEALSRRAEAMGVDLPENVQKYLIRHTKRDMESLLSVLTRVVNAAFSDKRRITVRLASEVIASESPD